MKKIAIALLIVFVLGCTKDEDVIAPEVVLAPLAPTKLIITNGISQQELILSWTDKSTNEKGFKIQRKGVNESYVTVGTVGADVTIYEDQGLDINTAYSYRVISYNDGGDSKTSNVVIASKDRFDVVLAPLAPTKLIVTSALDQRQLNLSWTDKSTNEKGFKIQRKGTKESYVTVATVGADVTVYEDKGLDTDTAYSYRVLSYNDGGDSMTYSNEVTASTDRASVINTPNVTIGVPGSQIWTTRNLEVTTYRDGTEIPQVTDPTEWKSLTTGAWCYYKNDTANGVIYGKLYNWYAVAGIWNEESKTNTNLRKKLAPEGYHIPNDTEWNTLITVLKGQTVAGGSMKAKGTSLWQSPNTGATNSSGFTGLPGGNRYSDGSFDFIGLYGNWWSSSEYKVGSTDALAYLLGYNNGIVYRNSIPKTQGYSVRCLRD
jgi:uncharacterized protein (TIGR02145 family)